MKTIAFAAVIAAGLAIPAQAQEYTVEGTAEVVEKNVRGHATKVRVDGEIYAVCMSDTQDDCINPRAAGLDWGDRPLAYWPGEPASVA